MSQAKFERPNGPDAAERPTRSSGTRRSVRSSAAAAGAADGVVSGERLRITSYASRFVPLLRLGQGGMAEIHLALRCGAAGFATPVVLKRLHARLREDPATLAMFLDEAALGARIRHPNIAQVLDFVQQDDDYCIVLEYLEG